MSEANEKATSHSGQAGVEREAWLASNLLALERRLSWLRAKPDGVIFVEPAGPQFVIVTKKNSHIRLLLVEQARPRSDLTQAHLDLDNPLSLISPYLQAMLLGLAWQSDPRRIYLAGLGGGRLALVLHHFFPAAVIDCAEIDPVVVDVAERFFGVRQDERLRVAVEDGREWLARPARSGSEVRYDLILLDVFLDNAYTPYRLATREFYQLCRRRMTENGVLVVNLLVTDPFYAAKIATIKSVFQQIALCPVLGDNRVLFATLGARLEKDALIERAKALQAKVSFPFPFDAWASALDMGQELGGGEGRILRDDAPPDNYFDSLPSFDAPFGRTEPELPCPCGSGRRLGDCHGRRGRMTDR